MSDERWAPGDKRRIEFKSWKFQLDAAWSMGRSVFSVQRPVSKKKHTAKGMEPVWPKILSVYISSQQKTH